MNDGDASSTVKLAELLRHPDDLHKIAALKSEFTRKKAAVDAQLKLGLAEQLQLTQAGMTSLHDGQSIVAAIKQEMISIDRLGAEAQSMIRNFPEINAVAQAHRNFKAVEAMQRNIEGFDASLDGVMRLLRDDEEDPETQPNLLRIHYGISQLRSIKEEAMEQIKKADDPSLEDTLNEVFKGLDDAVEDFDQHVFHACTLMLDLVHTGQTSLVVRLAVVVEEEEKYDMRIKELQEAQREFKDLASKFQTLAVGSREPRGYKDKFLHVIKSIAGEKMQESRAGFMENPDNLKKEVAWFFNDLNAVRKGMVDLMPKKWKIFRTYVKIYHRLMYDWLQGLTKDPEIAPTHMLAIIHWKERYLGNMKRLGANPEDLEPPLPGGHDGDLAREYRQLIVTKVDQWMTQLNRNDRESFLNREEFALDRDEDGHLRTKTMGDMWRMLREQLVVASTAQLTDITEGVCDAMFRAIKTRIDMWYELTSGELMRYTRASQSGGEMPSLDGIPILQDWLFALANDQMVSVHDEDDTGQGQGRHIGHLTSFSQDMSKLVSQEYSMSAREKVSKITDDMLDLSVHCLSVFTKLVFAIDFRTIMGDFFTPKWYGHGGARGGSSMGSIITTFEDYLNDYRPALHHILGDVLVQDLCKRLLQAYLSAVRNRGAKFRRQDDYQSRFRDDIQTVFAFFQKHANENTFQDEIKENWKVMQAVTNILDADKHVLPQAFRDFLQVYWDVKVGWVEALLRCRDDIDWGPLGDGRGIIKGIRTDAASLREQGPAESIMGPVE